MTPATTNEIMTAGRAFGADADQRINPGADDRPDAEEDEMPGGQAGPEPIWRCMVVQAVD